MMKKNDDDELGKEEKCWRKRAKWKVSSREGSSFSSQLPKKKRREEEERFS
jgi:hypothetical protein